jgi:hypothetical protein
VMDDSDAIGMEAAKKAGNNIVVLDGTESRRWQRTAAGVRAIWYKEVAAKGIDGAKLADEAQLLISKYDK